MILDEPVDGLDPVMRRQIWSILMSEVAERNMTVLVSSHNLRELEDVCDHVGIMHKGKLMIERSLSDLQGNISKIQVACQSGVPKLPDNFEVLHMANTGRVFTLIVKGNPKEAEAAIQAMNPTIVDILPLTLEEIDSWENEGRASVIKEFYGTNELYEKQVVSKATKKEIKKFKDINDFIELGDLKPGDKVFLTLSYSAKTLSVPIVKRLKPKYTNVFF